MKKLYVLFLLLLILLLAACSNDNKENTTKEVRFPEYFYEGLSKEEIEQDGKNSGASRVEFLEDGTIVYHFTESAWQSKFEDIESSLNGYLEDVVSNATYPSIVNASANKDFSVLTFVVNKDEYLNSQDNLAILGIGISATYYQLFLNKDELKVTAKIVDSVTAESVDQIIFPDDIKND